MKLRLNPEWSLLLESYKGDHKDARNRATHMIGIPMIIASVPVAATIVGLPLGAALFAGGWGFQFLGHWFEGNDPSFFSDRRSLAVGAMWFGEKAGLLQIESAGAPARAETAPLHATA